MSIHRHPRLAAPFALLFALAIAAGCASDEEKLAEFDARGRAAMKAEKYDEAIIEFRNVIQIDPNNADAHYALARSYLALQKLKEAYWELHESVRLDPDNLDARQSFAQFSLLARDLDEVLVQTDAILEQEPDNGLAHMLRGRALGRLDRLDEAEAAYIAAVEVDPENGDHLLNLIQFFSATNDHEAARPWVEKYIEVEPGFRAYTAAGRLHVRSQEPEQAQAAFLKALELAEESEISPGYRNLAGFYFNQGRVEDAVAALEEGIEKSTEKLDLIYLLARFYRSEGDDAKADELIERATEADPGNAQPFLVLSAYRGRKGDLEGAMAAVDQALEAAPDDQRARLRKAELLVDLGYRDRDEAKLDEGRGIVDAVLEVQPSSTEALFVKAKLQMAELDPKSAVTTLRSALDIRPDWAHARYVLGSALMLLGDQQAARAELARAVELDPGQLEARRSLARVHAALGEHEYAIEQGRRYLNERPSDRRTRILVAQSLVHIGKRDEAMEELEKIPAEDRDGDAWYAIGRLQMGVGEPETARASLLAALEERPNHPDILRSLHLIDHSLGLGSESAARIAKAVEAEPDNAKLAQLEGVSALTNEDLEAAEVAFKRATELDPYDATAYQQLAAFYRLTDRLDEAIETYQQSLRDNPSSALLHERIAILYEYNGDTASAVQHYEEAIALDSSLGESKNNLAYLLAESGGDLDRALDLAQEAKALLPDSPHTADTLGWVLYKRGIPSAAIGYLREAVAGMSPQDPTLGVVQHHLALAYVANEQPDEAQKSIDRALEIAQVSTPSGGAEPAWAGEVRLLGERLAAANN